MYIVRYPAQYNREVPGQAVPKKRFRTKPAHPTTKIVWNFCYTFQYRKIIGLTLQEFHLGSFVLEFFRHDYNNLGRFTQLCQTFDLFVCLLIGFFFISMNYNPMRTGISYYFIKGAGGWVSRKPPNVLGRAVCRTGLYNHHMTGWNSLADFLPILRGFLPYNPRAYILIFY
jgi:hypothetical protein